MQKQIFKVIHDHIRIFHDIRTEKESTEYTDFDNVEEVKNFIRSEFIKTLDSISGNCSSKYSSNAYNGFETASLTYTPIGEDFSITDNWFYVIINMEE